VPAQPTPQRQKTQATATADTIFNNPESYTVKHPLQQTWVLWFDNPTLLSKRATEEDWEKNLEPVSNTTHSCPLQVELSMRAHLERIYVRLLPLHCGYLHYVCACVLHSHK